MDDRVRVVLEIYVGDLETFADLIPEDWLKDRGTALAPQEERLRRFARETFQILTGTGERLPATLELVEPRLRQDRFSPYAGMVNPITGQPLPCRRCWRSWWSSRSPCGCVRRSLSRSSALAAAAAPSPASSRPRSS